VVAVVSAAPPSGSITRSLPCWCAASLVLKLPAERIDALIATGAGVRFDANKGTAMKEWFSLGPDSRQPWLPLAREALDFARSAR
jgi:hypothetical protein